MAAAISPNIARSVEENIRTLAETKRIRVTEFFKDFDSLRSGQVSASQFFRTLWQTLGVKLSEEEEAALTAKYDAFKSGRINYKEFCDTIEKPFNPIDLSKDPFAQKRDPQEFLGTSRSVRPLTASAEDELVKLLRSMQQFYLYHGINLRTCYEDFDRHHIGVITESQFYRNFPGPAITSESDMNLLVRKYRDPDRPGLVNYLNLHHDLVALGQQDDRSFIQAKMPSELNIDFTPSQAPVDPTLHQIFDKIKIAVFKNGIRTIEFFKDHDKLRSGVITENQFICGLTLAVGKEAQLSRAEIQKVAEYYRTHDGRVNYKDFCDMMENAFSIPNLEKKPQQHIMRPPRGALSRFLKPLDEQGEARVREVIHELAEVCRKRRLMMYPYFKDYDRGIAYTRVVTQSQFARILHFLSLNVANEDLKLLCAKFQDPASGDVNYPAFVQAVDQEFVGHTMGETEDDKKPFESSLLIDKPKEPPLVSFEELIARLRHIVLTNRLRVADFFQDYDQLRSGSITKDRFRRGLSSLGFSKLGTHDLNEGQFQMLCKAYQSPDKEDQVIWTRFMEDIESVFTSKDLEKDPDAQVAPSEIFRVPKPGSVTYDAALPDHKAIFEATMERLRQRASQRRILAKPVFQDFDKHNNGHITRSQFRQCLNILELHTTEPEMQALEAIYCNDVGFNYLAFLAQLQPQPPLEPAYANRMVELRKVNNRAKLPELNAATDLENTLLKIKTKVKRERIRVLEFMRDYDKLRSGRMLKTSFRRALDLCRFELKESEIDMLEDKYESPGQPDYVDYLRFSDDVESIFTTKDLEKTPLAEVNQFEVPIEWVLNELDPKNHAMLMAAMDKIADKVRRHRMQLFPLFEDYDRVHNGAVSRSQFRRVLSELGLESMLTQQELEFIWQKFNVKVGGKDDVNYIAFCDLIYETCNFEWRKP